MRTASPMSAPPRGAGFSEASSTPARLPAAIWRTCHISRAEFSRGLPQRLDGRREDDIRRPDGTNGIYGVIDKPTYALVIADDSERVALVERVRFRSASGVGELPQGAAPEPGPRRPR